jgi:NAD(P)-dependent dehydrogenase (short-subunit alcohol dehydrogenase family)
MSINVLGAFLHAKHALPELVPTEGATVTVCSITGRVGLKDQSIYSASKGALVRLTRQLAIDYAPFGVRVNAVAPGAIDPNFAVEAPQW